ncbi:YSC84-related protein [Sulfurovum sp.]|uniref:lipid-binding SYLF domain-containing protein n=1 Tax=Sulfurovum sp. TaxID=1969726 RepID=UPI0025F46412|nr:YSC84-related protein [Sulfurovum sp.]
MRKRLNPLSIMMAAILLFGSCAMAEPASVIEAKVNEAIKQFDKEVKGGEKFLSKVKGYLVFPSVVKGGFVIGGEYGEGALRVNGKTLHYYSMASGSIGFQAGLQKRSVIIAFVSESALKNFIKSDGWEAGVDGAITVVKWGVGKDISSISYEKPIYAFVYGAKGLMYNLTLEGTKFTRIIPQ